jgi:hypothetical protein
VSGSSSTWGSPTEPPSGGLLSKPVSTLDSVDIIALNKMRELDLVRFEGRAGRVERERRPAYKKRRRRLRERLLLPASNRA